MEKMRRPSYKEAFDRRWFIKHIKRQVKDMRRKTGFPRRACQNIVARNNGFFNWDILMMSATDRHHDGAPTRNGT